MKNPLFVCIVCCTAQNGIFSIVVIRDNAVQVIERVGTIEFIRNVFKCYFKNLELNKCPRQRSLQITTIQCGNGDTTAILHTFLLFLYYTYICMQRDLTTKKRNFHIIISLICRSTW